MIKKAKITIYAISFYFSLRSQDVPGGPYPTAIYGEMIYNELVNAIKRGVQIKLIANIKNESMPNTDMYDLLKLAPNQVQIKFIDMSHKTEGYVGGINHSKMWIIDNYRYYVGSANMDWRAYSENIESGIYGRGGKQIIQQLKNIFDKSWEIGINENNEPTNKTYKMQFLSTIPIIISSSPNIISKSTNTITEFDAILSVINNAKSTLRITTYEYNVKTIFSEPKLSDFRIHNAIIHAATERNVDKLFEIPDKCESKLDPEIPYSKVWHSKIAISENKVWISTNNIDPSYFMLTAGIGITFDSTIEPYSKETFKIVKDAQDHFDRYWDSKYVTDYVSPE